MASQLLAKLTDTSLFLKEWVNDPRQIGAIMPSSRNLTTAMARWLPADRDAFVLELGPGTGAVTQALLKHGLPEDRLVAIEMSRKLAGHLRERFPRAHIITGNALQLDTLLKKHVKGLDNVGAVISSLPLRNFPPDQAETLARKIRGVLRPAGNWVQYSYHLGSERPQGTDLFRFLATNVVWFNLPPARISVYRK